jgi:nucleotide-binding universal stress UspA family protein
MYKKILIATDGSELADKAVEHGVGLAAAVGASVVFVTVTEIWPALEISREIERGELDAVEIYEEAAASSARAILDGAMALAKKHGVDAHIRHVKDRKAAEGIIESAELEDCDLIVMASHGRRGIQRMLIGSQTAEVLGYTTRPVLVLR